jgi:hypothetical protein
MSAGTLYTARRHALESQRAVIARCPSVSECVRSVDWLDAETEKLRMRIARFERFAADKPRRDIGQAEPWSAVMEEWRDFWGRYQEVNDRRIPSDPVYTGARGNFTLSTTNDIFTYTSPAAGQARIIEFYVGGEATTSAVNRISCQRSTSGTTPTNQTLELMSTRSPAAAGTSATTWSTFPTLSGNPWYQLGLNAFGGSDRWVSQPGAEFYLVNGEKKSWRSASGTSVVDFTYLVEEL